MSFRRPRLSRVYLGADRTSYGGGWSVSSIYRATEEIYFRAMDTATYAAAAALPQWVVQSLPQPFRRETEFVPLDLWWLKRLWLWKFRSTEPCNDI